MIDWQTLVAILITGFAGLYLVRRGFLAVRWFRPVSDDRRCTHCAAGCGVRQIHKISMLDQLDGTHKK